MPTTESCDRAIVARREPWSGDLRSERGAKDAFPKMLIGALALAVVGLGVRLLLPRGLGLRRSDVVRIRRGMILAAPPAEIWRRLRRFDRVPALVDGFDVRLEDLFIRFTPKGLRPGTHRDCTVQLRDERPPHEMRFVIHEPLAAEGDVVVLIRDAGAGRSDVSFLIDYHLHSGRVSTVRRAGSRTRIDTLVSRGLRRLARTLENGETERFAKAVEGLMSERS